jgi:hypothetical protein
LAQDQRQNAWSWFHVSKTLHRQTWPNSNQASAAQSPDIVPSALDLAANGDVVEVVAVAEIPQYRGNNRQ